jgi:magnesium transporter
LENRVKEIKRAVHDVLENDESRLMYLSDSNDPKTAYVHKKLKDDCDLDSNDEKFDTMYVEMMFEAYLNELEWIAAEIEEIIDEITNTEESVELQIDLLRNRILKFELMLSIASFVGTCAAVVTGLFGMNLLSHLESNIFGFYTISFLLVVGCGTLYKVLVTTAKRDALF